MKWMRPLKLRVWDSAQKKFHYGGACHKVGRHRWFFGLPIPHPDDCELMQFTGVTDYNGTEIYEGDVVAYFQNDVREIRAGSSSRTACSGWSIPPSAYRAGWTLANSKSSATFTPTPNS